MPEKQKDAPLNPYVRSLYARGLFGDNAASVPDSLVEEHERDERTSHTLAGSRGSKILPEMLWIVHRFHQMQAEIDRLKEALAENEAPKKAAKAKEAA